MSSPKGDSAFPWWEWRDATASLPSEERRVAEAIGRAVEGRGPQVAETAARNAADSIDLEGLWSAVAAMQRSLDAAAASAPADELAEARRRLEIVAGRLWSLGSKLENRLLRRFFGGAVHDLRSPLHSIVFLSEGLYQGDGGHMNELQPRQVEIIYSASTVLLKMTNDLLDFAHAGDEAFDDVAAAPFSPSEVVEDVVRLTRPLARHLDAELVTSVTTESAYVGDPQLLRRVLLNLVCNSLEAAGERCEVRVKVGPGPGGKLRSTVEDDGFVDEERLETIRGLLADGAESDLLRDEDANLRGLGLVISNRLVRAAGGDLTVERSRSGETGFLVSLPFFPHEESEEASPAD